jgi:outer membrane protein assembly factor BamE (lipoprotein component of BamABCDE complex)
MKFSLSVIVGFTALCFSASGMGDVLLLDKISNSPVNSEEGVPRPTGGMTMDQVRNRFGEPAVAHPWIGDPPITRWDYPEYSVFFEYQHVLTSVLHADQ